MDHRAPDKKKSVTTKTMVQKRVFVGGLYPGVKQEELKQRFSSYGTISDVEIKVKRDSEGNPVKTFAYLDIDASDTDLQKCFRTYNKTRWKGSELSLQFAKENFIKRLEVERQDQINSPNQSPSKSELTPTLTDSPGVEKFNIKGAVPGTTIPGQRDWTVGKYGRVLPVVNIMSKDKRKLLKVDPSKYTHNLKRMKDDVAKEPGPVSTNELTWELADNDNDLTKKRKGEFPSWKSSKRKFEAVQESFEMDSDMEVVPGSDHRPNKSSPTSDVSSGKPNKKWKEEGKKKHVTKQTENVFSSSFTYGDKNELPKKSIIMSKAGTSDDGYDSGDTDEIIAVSKKNKYAQDLQKRFHTSPKSDNVTKIQINPLQEKLVSLAMTETVQSQKGRHSYKDERIEKETIKAYVDKSFRKTGRGGNKQDDNVEVDDNPLMEFRGTKFLDDDNDSRGVTAGEQAVGSSHGQVIKNIQETVNISHLESEDSESDFETLVKKGVSDTTQATHTSTKSTTRTPTFRTQKAKFNDYDSASSADTDEILSSSKLPKQTKISKSDKRNKQKVISSELKFDEFSSGLNQGSETLHNFSASYKGKAESSEDESDFETLVKKELEKHKQKGKHISESSTVHNRITEKESLKHHRKQLSDIDTGSGQNRNYSGKQKWLEYSENDGVLNSFDTKEVNMKNKDIFNMSRSNTYEKNSSVKTVDIVEDVDKKRQETVRQRQKDYMAQKSVIQKALANLDEGPSSNKKIIFDSDDSSDDVGVDGLDNDTDDYLEKEQQGNNLMSSKKSGGLGLFGDSSDESSEEEQDGNMFKLRPEFEGSSGKKLMKLQSRYGNDERFKLDTRFAESDSEPEENGLEEEDEKTRQLKILASVIGTTAGITVDKRDKAKKVFKDVSQLHFDPTKDEHSQFEIKTAQKPALEKIEKKKKKKRSEEIEAETEAQPDLPEVSKERFVEVSDSLKSAFAKKSEDEPKGFSLLATFGKRDSDSEEDSDEEATAKPFTGSVDKLTLDSRFKVTNSDSEHEENSDNGADEDSGEAQAVPTTDVTSDYIQPSTFFFTDDDPRLKDGEKFYRTEDLETVRERWLEKRPEYIDSYKSKHKKFRRKQKKIQQSKPTGGRKRKTR